MTSKRFGLPFVFLLCASVPLWPMDTKAIDQALGRRGTMAGDVYKIAAPRTDLRVVVDGVEVKAGMALGSWIAFRDHAGGTGVHGDLCLLEREVNPVASKLEELGLEVTSLHNHLMHAQPNVMFMHFWGHGDAVKLAGALKAALALTATPVPPDVTTMIAEPVRGTEVIEKALGRKGNLNRGVLQFAIARREKITMHGMEMPPAMGMATAINFINAPKGVAATGDYVMTEDEVDRVIRALRAANIEITALHNHMVQDNPRLVFLHFWAHGDPATVARGLRSALDQTKVVAPQ